MSRRHYHLSGGKEIDKPELTRILLSLGQRVDTLESINRAANTPIPNPGAGDPPYNPDAPKGTGALAAPSKSVSGQRLNTAPQAAFPPPGAAPSAPATIGRANQVRFGSEGATSTKKLGTYAPSLRNSPTSALASNVPATPTPADFNPPAGGGLSAGDPNIVVGGTYPDNTIDLAALTGAIVTNGTAVGAGAAQAQTALTIVGVLTTSTAIWSLPNVPDATWQTGIFVLLVCTADTVTPYLVNPTAAPITPIAQSINIRAFI